MKNYKKDTIAEILDDALKASDDYHPRGVVNDLLEIQRRSNSRSTHMADAVRYGTWPAEPVEPKKKSIFHDVISSWKSLMYSITGLRIVHKDDICNCEDY